MSVDDLVDARADCARKAWRNFAHADTRAKNALLEKMADALEFAASNIAEANKKDLKEAEAKGMDAGKLDRLKFNEERIQASAKSVRKIAQLQDPVEIGRAHV